MQMKTLVGVAREGPDVWFRLEYWTLQYQKDVNL